MDEDLPKKTRMPQKPRLEIEQIRTCHAVLCDLNASRLGAPETIVSHL